MKLFDVFLAVMVAAISGLAFVASRIALDEFSPEQMTTQRFSIAAVPCLPDVILVAVDRDRRPPPVAAAA